MSFSSYIFILLFLPISIIGYFLVGKSKNTRISNIYLIILSLIFLFYGFNWAAVITLIISILFNYGISIQLNKTKQPKALLAFGIIINVAALIIFKYTNNISYYFDLLFNNDYVAKNIILPLGISFYTFQQISFLVDAYRKEIPQYSFIDYVCYVAFFPKIISGPIIRHEEMLPQLQNNERLVFNWENFSKGLYRFAIGLAKKVLIADVLASAVTLTFNNSSSFYCINTMIGVLSFTLQLYFDFSGYCDMAIGISKMMNINIPENFNSPYKALNIKDFWNRWHITLTKFLTKYIYIPLGGNRKGTFRTYVNILIIFVISGLWHGSDIILPFLLWGLMHGFASVIYRLFNKKIDKFNPVVNWLLTFSFVALSWIPFRSQSLGVTKTTLTHMFSLGHLGPISNNLCNCFRFKEFAFIERIIPGLSFVSERPWIYVVVFLIVLMLVILNTKNSREMTEEFKPSVVNVIFTVLIFVWSILSITGVGTFIYAGF